MRRHVVTRHHVTRSLGHKNTAAAAVASVPCVAELVAVAVSPLLAMTDDIVAYSPASSSDSDYDSPKRTLDEGSDHESRRKRRRMKNREAAQHSRERKKMQMAVMEERLAILEAENRRLSQKVEELSTQNANLESQTAVFFNCLDDESLLNDRLTEAQSFSSSGDWMKSESSVFSDLPLFDDQSNVSATPELSEYGMSDESAALVYSPQLEMPKKKLSSVFPSWTALRAAIYFWTWAAFVMASFYQVNPVVCEGLLKRYVAGEITAQRLFEMIKLQMRRRASFRRICLGRKCRGAARFNRPDLSSSY